MQLDPPLCIRKTHSIVRSCKSIGSEEKAACQCFYAGPSLVHPTHSNTSAFLAALSKHLTGPRPGQRPALRPSSVTTSLPNFAHLPQHHSTPFHLEAHRTKPAAIATRNRSKCTVTYPLLRWLQPQTQRNRVPTTASTLSFRFSILVHSSAPPLSTPT